MTLLPPRPGPGLVVEYQVSGIPWVTSSTVLSGTVKRVDFDYATRFFHVKNTALSASTIAFGFTENGLLSSNNFFTLQAGETWGDDIRCKSLWLMALSGSTGSFSIIAGLTSISSMSFPVITGGVIYPQPDAAVFNGVG